VALLLPFGNKFPTVASDAFLAPTAVLVGDVTVESEASVWFGAVLRGDHEEHGISVGPRTSVQDNCVVHVGNWQPTRIGADVTVGHGAKFESCTIEDGSVIGMNAVILQEAVVGAGSVVAANAVVLEGTEIPPGSLVAGVPARLKGPLRGSAEAWGRRSSGHYVALSREYLRLGHGELPRCDECGAPLVARGAEPSCPFCVRDPGTRSRTTR
jgi:carbonic anhydrase/acetyltransferase-like protein (isoleucine patch superfamily)